MSAEKLCARATRLQPSPSNRHTRQLIEKAIRATGESIVSNQTCRRAFYRLANCLRGPTGLLSPRRLNSPRGTEQLSNVLQVCSRLARFHKRWINGPESWDYSPSNCVGGTGQKIRELINHLLVTKTVPAFMYKCWFADDNSAQAIFVHVAAGNSIRGTNFGNSLTKQMARRLNDAPADSNFSDAKHFAITGKLSRSKPDFPCLMTKRRKKAWVINPCWHPTISWPRLKVQDFYHTEFINNRLVEERTWIIRQLTSQSELNFESKRLQHCVDCYWGLCHEGRTSIWSMESRDILRTTPLLTIEVRPKTLEIRQIRGFQNRGPRKKEILMIENWANRESLSLERWLSWQ